MKALQKLSKCLSDYTSIVVIAIAVVTFIVPGMMGWVNHQLFTDPVSNKFTSQSIIHIQLLPVRTTHRLSENNDKIRCCSRQRISVNNIFFSMIIIFPCTDMSRKNFSTNAFLIDLSVCSYGTYITSFSLYVPTTFHQSFSKC